MSNGNAESSQEETQDSELSSMQSERDEVLSRLQSNLLDASIPFLVVEAQRNLHYCKHCLVHTSGMNTAFNTSNEACHAQSNTPIINGS